MQFRNISMSSNGQFATKRRQVKNTIITQETQKAL